ncbi:hypothetical protein AB0892_10400 [Streptomyces sp. NPDC005409]|uniref:hypothetical protein n=1 Tax=Streptomyces sp. NPDC005409 TaxID=3155342 RepID=UPI0034529A44
MDRPAYNRSAWPFLVARGRHRGYRTLLAPDFLLADGDYGVLDDSVTPGRVPEQVQVVPVVTRSGRHLTVVHTTHQVTAADVDEAPRDEFGRPLRLMYGFVCEEGRFAAPDPADLDACRATALAAYRRFLGDEEGFTVEPGRQFALRSPVTSRGTGTTDTIGTTNTTGTTRTTDTTGTTGQRRRVKGSSGASVPSRTGCLIRVAILVLIGVLVYVLATQCPPPPPNKCTPVSVLEPCHPYVDEPSGSSPR